MAIPVGAITGMAGNLMGGGGSQRPNHMTDIAKSQADSWTKYIEATSNHGGEPWANLPTTPQVDQQGSALPNAAQMTDYINAAKQAAQAKVQQGQQQGQQEIPVEQPQQPAQQPVQQPVQKPAQQPTTVVVQPAQQPVPRYEK